MEKVKKVPRSILLGNAISTVLPFFCLSGTQSASDNSGAGANWSST